MAEISKHMFDAVCPDIHCSVMLHPWGKSCWSSSVDTYIGSFLGSAKFYLLIHLVQNMFKGKKILQREELMKAGEYYVRSTLLGGMISGTGVTLACLLRWAQGRKFSYYSYLLIPNMINGLFILLEPPSRRGLIVNLFCNMVIEYWLRSLERAGYISITRVKMTIMFMLGSSLLFYLMRLEGDREKRTPLLWLFTPEKVRKKTNNTKDVCPHNGPCLKYILKGTSIYFGVGLALSTVKLLRPLIQSPSKTLANINLKHLQLAMFFGSYTGIYRAIVCYLCRKRGLDSATYALPAGCFAGVSLLLKPNLGFAIASLSGAFKLFSTILYERKAIPNNINLPLLLYCFCQGTLFHARFMHPNVCPSYIFKLMRTVSNGKTDLVYTIFDGLFKNIS